MSEEVGKKLWYRLDNAGKLYPSITSTRVSTVFRVSATLFGMVDKARLQKALDSVIERFPYFRVSLKRGLFWYYYETSTDLPQVEDETYYPCMFLMYKKRGVFPFRVLVFRKKISLEISHSITDATGALAFLKSLLAEYLTLSGCTYRQDDSIFLPGEEPKPGEFQDSFHTHYQSHMPRPLQVSRAYQFPFELLPKGEYSIVTGIMDSRPLLNLAREHGASLTELFTALYFDAVQQHLNETGDPDPLPVVLNVPVNLRSFFVSTTMRNFFVSVTPTIDFRRGHHSFVEILNHVKHEMGLMLTKKYLRLLICRNVKPEKPLVVRLIPLYLKKVITQLIFREFGEKNNTSSISNLGLVKLPDGLAEHVERFEFFPPPGKGNVVKVGIVSYDGKVYITFGSLTDEKSVERIFFRMIRRMGVRVKIETNSVEQAQGPS